MVGGLEQFNQTNVTVVNFLYRLPKASTLAHNNAVVKGIFDNWELSGIGTFTSGFPYTVTATSSTGLNYSGSTIAARINMVPGCDPNSGPKIFTDWMNLACFAAPTKGTFGNSGPNNFIGPGINNIDLSLMKNIPLGSEKRSLRIRAEAYNALNHTQFSNINTAARFDANGNQINSQFGQATATRAPRVIQLNATLFF